VSLINEPGLYRTGDGNLHVAYERDASGNATIGHTVVKASGATGLQNVAVPGWESIVSDPKGVPLTGGGIRLVFGGIRSLSPGFWTDGRIYTATGNEAGSAWNLPAEAIGLSHSGYASYGTGATTLADGTPVASFPLNSVLTWHVGTGGDPDGTYTFGDCCVYYSTLTRNGTDVYAAFYANGDTAGTNGTFVKKIYPSVGATTKVPNSSEGSSSLAPGQAVAMTTRPGGGVFVAFCVGYPTCTSVGVWKVGAAKVHKIPHSAGATDIAISAGPSGRLWIAWDDATPKVFAVRTGTTGLTFGAIRVLKRPAGSSAIYHLAIEGTAKKADIVINTGSGLFHQQVLPGLTLSANDRKWDGDSPNIVTFRVSDAGAPVGNAKVKVGTRSCTTGGNGTCKISFPSLPAGKLTATASKAGYAKATLKLTVLA
jgi:hypothetical protein